MCDHRHETVSRIQLRTPRQGEVPRRRRPQGHRQDAPQVQAEPAAHQDRSQRSGEDRPRQRQGDPLRPREAAVEEEAVHDAVAVDFRSLQDFGSLVKPMSLSTDQVRWVAHLARLELTDEETATFTRDLTAIVDYVNQLQSVNTDNVEPLAHAVELTNVFRADELAESLPVDEALANAPL